MALNYVGSISIVDRGDAPAQAIIDKYHRSMAKRVADETKEELEAVLKRVDNIYGNFELSENLYEANRAANTEYVNDLMELEDLIKDQVKKKKYQQQVTIFIVGYEHVCGQKLKLLQQVNEFFTDNSTKMDDEELLAITQEREQFDLEEMSETVENTLATCNSLAERLGELNHEMADYLDRVVSNKASNKSKKKLEKALSQAKSEIEGLNDKLKGLHTEIEEKEDKIQQMFKQIELKNMETQRYRTAAEVAKKSAEQSEQLREEIAQRDRLVQDLKKQIDGLQLEVGSMQNSTEQNLARNKNQQQEAQTKLGELQKTLEQRHVEEEERRRDLQRVHEVQIGELKEATRREVEELRQQHAEEVKKLLEDSDYYEAKKRENRVTSEVAVQDDGHGPTGGRAETVTLQPVTEANFDDQFPLNDNGAWAAVPPEHLPGRFVQYRQLAQAKIEEMQETIDVTINRTVRKINTLKAQFLEHKEKWQSERSVLVSQMEQAESHRSAAEREADTAMEQLEEFVNEQETLELEEEARRAELEEQASDMIAQSGASLEEAKAKLAMLERKREEEELQRNLLEQTDDAKAELSRLASGKLSPNSDDQSATTKQQEPTSTSPLATTAQDEVEGDDWFPRYKQFILDSISSMLDAETLYADAQHRALQAVRAVLLTGSKQPPASAPAILEEAEAGAVGGKPLMRSTTTVVELPVPVSIIVSPQEAGQTRALYTLISHLSLETERLGVDPGSMYHCLSQLYANSLTALKAEDNMLFTVPTQEKVPYERLRKVHYPQGTSPPGAAGAAAQSVGDAAGSSSARSRTSHHRGVLASLRASAEDRRSKSPAVLSFHSQKSVLSDAELDEDGDMPFPQDVDKEMHDIGTSPMTPQSLSSRKGIQMFEHPIVQEYLRAYEAILTFKDNLARFFLDKEEMSMGQALSELEQVHFDEGAKVQPQIEKMTTSIYRILEESAHVVTNALGSDREYPVSSLNMSSRDPTRLLTTRERTPDSDPSALRRAADKSAVQSEAAAKEILMLREHCQQVGQQLAEEGKRHQDETHHNTVVMMEMQNTINSLRRELSMVGKNEEVQDIQRPMSESPIMFTRLDSERNAKTMKRAVNEKKLHTENYKVAVDTMKEYTSLPAKRFVHLVHKYVHHRQMKQIEDNVSRSKSLNDGVFMILDKMESLQNMRAQKWADKMDNMGAERLRLAGLLMETLDSIERQSGIFLIKPMFSYKGSYNPNKYTGPVSNPFSGNKDMMGNLMHHPNSLAPVPTPASNTRGMRKIFLGAESAIGHYATSTRPASASELQTGGGDFHHPMGGDFPRPVWNPGMSQMLHRYPTNEESRFLQSYMNTPRLLELDINRMLIGQNQISTRVTPGVSGDDRLSNAAQGNVRSYVTVNRPSGNMLPKVDPAIRAHTGGREHHQSPLSGTGSPQRKRTGGPGVHVTTSSTPPLPPITPTPRLPDTAERPLPPMTPPGSSLCATPPVRAVPPSTPAYVADRLRHPPSTPRIME